MSSFAKALRATLALLLGILLGLLATQFVSLGWFMFGVASYWVVKLPVVWLHDRYCPKHGSHRRDH